MAIFTAYDNSEILAALQDAAPHAEIHIDDKIAREHSANGNAQREIAGKILAYVAVSDVADIQGVLKSRVNIICQWFPKAQIRAP